MSDDKQQEKKELAKADFKKLSPDEQRKHLREKRKHMTKLIGGRIPQHLRRENDLEPKLNEGNRNYARALAAGLGSGIDD